MLSYYGGAVLTFTAKEIAQTAVEEATGVEIPVDSAKKITKEVKSIVKISPQKQAGYIKGTAQYKNRIK